MANDPHDQPASRPAPTLHDLHAGTLSTVRPEGTRADRNDSAPVTAPPYVLSGASAVARSVTGQPERVTPSIKTSAVTLTAKASFVPSAARGEASSDSVEVAPDDLIEVEFDHGERMWVRGDDFRVNFAPAVVGRDATGSERVEVPSRLPVASRGLESRGPVAWAIKGLKVFGVDLGALTASKIGSRIDDPKSPSKTRQKPGRLYRCTTVTGGFDLLEVDATQLAVDKPWLVFIHGTLSSTWGSFGELWSEARAAQLNQLRMLYADRVLAFEHATLTESPIKNAWQLARQLPANSRLHLVSHSRGGLVGELMCRAGVLADDGATPTANARAFGDEQLAIFAGDEGTTDKPDSVCLAELEQLFQQKKIVIERFVRVACPALGTTLASGRLDRWLSVIGTVAGAALPGSPLSEVFKDIGDFVAAVVKQRTDPKTLPGLEAQMPDARCIKLVNWPSVRVAGDLAVIAGDIEPTALWSRLLVWLSDRFYEGDHDLVVNTPSMLGGARRSGVEVVSSHKGATVNHFSYFSEQNSADRLLAALAAPPASAAAGFEPLHKPTKPIARAVAARATDRPLPHLFVLPGIMGSGLKDSGGAIWVALLALLRGGMTRLDIDRQEIEATEPLERYYGEIIEHLSASHTVVPFPFDWRIDIEREADRLARAVRQQLEIAKAQGQPLRFLAHSMGGLIVRMMIARHPDVWRDVTAYEGARFVMLGTPNGGSHAITELLVGESVVLRKLVRLDVRNGRKELLNIISRFPGVLAMLPRADAEYDYCSHEVWSAWYSRAQLEWLAPRAADLERAAEVRRLLDSSPIDPQRMAYVAGSSAVTIAGAKLTFDPWKNRDRIEFVATTRGDGRVTWDSGIPPQLHDRTWYVDVEHGDLAAHRPSFAGITELLTKGTTALLDQRPLVSRSALDLFPLPPAEDDRFPDEEDLVAAVLGAGSRRHRSRPHIEKPLQVAVVHGNLSFSRFMVAVGHYAGDSIVSAEGQLDLELKQALTRRHALGLYPGPIETNATFHNPLCRDSRFLGMRGAIVVGLGTVGSLTTARLTRTFARGLLEYALEHQQRSGGTGEDACALDVCAVLIGTNAGGVTVGESVYALVRGALDANEKLRAAKLEERIRRLELIELWEDRAVDAIEALDRLSRQPALRDLLDVTATIETGDGGLRRLHHVEPSNWWDRLQILGGVRPGEVNTGALRFSAVTKRARAEVRLLATQRQLVDQFVERAIGQTSDDRDIARALFELLLPNDLKDTAHDQDDLVLLVDEEAARYPWELLDDGRSADGKPWVIRHGLLRQLESIEFVERVRPVHEQSALVVGDPRSSFVELKGAQAEAEAVWRTLNGRFSTRKVIRRTAPEIVSELFAREYRIVHLAGHGVYRYVAKSASAGGETAPFTGMVLGDNVFLTPAEVRQMRSVPDLVFINCCHLGYIEQATGDMHQRELAFPRLAANLATEFIRSGVRAVVAAGWAVNDLAATVFATTFYDEMLRGNSFGEAIRIARIAAYERYPNSNTWGAYQCYGDPGFRLVLDGATHQRETLRIVSAGHAAQELSNIAARLKTGAARDRQGEIETARQIKAVVEQRQQWIRQGAVLAALGRAYAEAGLFEEAIDFYTRALRAPDGAATIKDLEQLANLQARQAATEWQAKTLDAECAADRIEQAIAHLQHLAEGAEGGEPFGATSERLSLIASAYKRLALLQTGDGRAEALRQMEFWYRKAADLAETQQDDVAYPLINAAAAAVILHSHHVQRAEQEQIDAVDRLAAEIAARFGIETSEEGER